MCLGTLFEYVGVLSLSQSYRHPSKDSLRLPVSALAVFCLGDGHRVNLISEPHPKVATAVDLCGQISTELFLVVVDFALCFRTILESLMLPGQI